MKKILFLFLFLGLVSGLKAAEGLDVYSTSLTTYAITNSIWKGAQIDGYARIHKILLSNSSTSTAQTVTFYSLADATSTATAEFYVTIPAGQLTPVILDYPIAGDPYVVNDVAARKSSTSSTVYMAIWYR